MTWPLAAVTIVAIVGLTIIFVAPLHFGPRFPSKPIPPPTPPPPPPRHHIDPDDAATQVEWPKREEQP